jgi:hypothetical protein
MNITIIYQITLCCIPEESNLSIKNFSLILHKFTKKRGKESLVVMICYNYF